MKTYRISELASLHGLTRSTLLHYDKIRLLSASGRSFSNYREYTEKDRKKLGKIRLYREAGLSLEAIQHILSSSKKSITQSALEMQLRSINQSIGILRLQQQITARLLMEHGCSRRRVLNKETWVNMFRSIGLTEKQMENWHQKFEANSPEAHHDFLLSLGLGNEEIRRIRKRFRAAAQDKSL